MLFKRLLRRFAPRNDTNEKKIASSLCCAALLAMTPSLVFASVAGDVNKAGNLYKQKKYDDSVALYSKALDEDNASSLVKYDLGTALYKKGDYADAQGYLQQAEQDKNFKLKTKAEYNLGNDLYQSGKTKEGSDVDTAIKSMTAALSQYEQTIKDDPKDENAQFNEDFVKKEIERLKEQKRQQQQQQQNQQNKNQQQQNQQNQQNQQSGQNQQNQQQQDKQKQQQAQQNQQQQQQQQEQQSQQQQDKKIASSPSAPRNDTEEKVQETQQEIDRKQAEDLLEDYKENEEPKKLLNYMPQKIDNRPVVKDW